MTAIASLIDAGATQARLRSALEAALPSLSHAACSDDKAACFPVATMEMLRACGMLRAVLPRGEGGSGFGTDRAATPALLQALARIGGAHLSLARLFEGHVNGFALLWHHGTPSQRHRLCAYVREGRLLGVWNAPSPAGPLRLIPVDGGFRLQGTKIYASGAGSIAKPLLTATDEHGQLLMLWTDVTNAAVDLTHWQVHGMKATATGTVILDGVPVASDDLFGDDQAYHRQPAFSGGAWRFLAAQLGAAGAMVDLMKGFLVSAKRSDDAHQRARLAEATMALETGRLWITAAAAMAEDPAVPVADAVGYVGMARLVVEESCLSVIALAQRSVGLQSLLEANPLERIARDLSTYLRQPVPDAIRDAVAGGALASAVPSLDRWMS